MRGYPEKVFSSERYHESEVAARLWEVAEQLTGVHFNLEGTKSIAEA